MANQNQGGQSQSERSDSQSGAQNVAGMNDKDQQKAAQKGGQDAGQASETDIKGGDTSIDAQSSGELGKSAGSRSSDRDEQDAGSGDDSRASVRSGSESDSSGSGARKN